MTDPDYIYFYGGEGRKYSVYISPEDGSCMKCPSPSGRNPTLMLLAALVVVVLAGFLNRWFQVPLHGHPKIAFLMIVCAVIGALITFRVARGARKKRIAEQGQPVLKNEVSKAHLAAAMRQWTTDRNMLLILSAAALLCGIVFWFTSNILLWLCGAACLLVLAGLAGPMQLRQRKSMLGWLTVYESHPEWDVTLRYSKGYVVLSKNGRYFPDNNVQAVTPDGSVLWTIEQLLDEPVTQGYQLLERKQEDTFRLQSVSEDEFLLDAAAPRLEKISVEQNDVPEGQE